MHYVQQHSEQHPHAPARSMRAAVNRAAKKCADEAYCVHRDRLLAELADAQDSGQEAHFLARLRSYLDAPRGSDP